MSPLTRSNTSMSSTRGGSPSSELPLEPLRNDYTIGWICALAKEQTAATMMLDNRHQDITKQCNDPNTYSLGSIGRHNVVIACLPVSCGGSITAAMAAVWMTSAFPSIRLCLLVGIGSGIPSRVRLADVVVGVPMGGLPGVTGWKRQEGRFEDTGEMGRPPSILMSVITKLESKHELEDSEIGGYLDQLKDKWGKLAPRYLISKTLVDPSAGEDDTERARHNCTNYSLQAENEGAGHKESSLADAKDAEKRYRDARICHGLIASTSHAIRDEATRDSLASMFQDNQLLCIENEAVGLPTKFPCIVIRGICDYADNRVAKEWQEPAATMAAAFAKEVLSALPADEVKQMPTIKERGPSVF